ncbi:hypothetical protein BGX29_003366 [Mortierella sp. GBA35]|nr:hypothetical protein BGX29_003366 [Mortierella sp. GBA35]
MPNAPGIFADTMIEQPQLAAARRETRQGRREFIRAKAQEVRLELLALEQLEKEIDSELGDEDACVYDVDLLFSPTGSPSGTQPTYQQTGSVAPFSNSNAAVEPTSGLVRHPPQPPIPDSIRARSQQFRGHQQRIPSTMRTVPTRSSSSSGTTHGVSPVSKLAIGTGTQSRSGAVTSTPSPTSPHSSPSPPISPLSTTYTEDGAIAEGTSGRIIAPTQAQVNKFVGWRPDIHVQDAWDSHLSPAAEEDKDDEHYEYLNESEEDLRDITLSDMVAKNLNMLSDSDDTDSGGNFDAQGSRPENDHVGEQDFDEANMTIVDRTCIFMSSLEHDFDQQAAAGQGIPSLLSETLPENDYDISSQPPTQEATVKESIMDDFLRPLPPLPQSPESYQSFPQDNSPGVVDESLQSAQHGSGRTLPVLAPIVTSREHCQQVLQRRKRNGDQRRHSSIRSQSPLSLTSPVTGVPHSEFSTPLPYDDSPSDLSTPSSAYHTAKEDLSPSSAYFSEDSGGSDGMKKYMPAGSESAMNMSSELIQLPPAPEQETRRARIEATVAILSGSPNARHQPLDMIIIRPTRSQPGNLLSSRSESATSSPWFPLSPTQSIDSRHSEGTGGPSWSWSYPSSLQSTVASLGSNSVDGLAGYSVAEGKDVASKRRPNFSTSNMGVKIKSRSMSSLTKHQHGWLGFQALDVRMVASGRSHIVVVTRSNQVHSCWEPNSDEMVDPRSLVALAASAQDIELALGRGISAENSSGYVQDTALYPVLVKIGGVDTLESPIVKIACSDSATFLLTEAGDLWSWGTFENMDGDKVGLLHQNSATRPILICSQSQRIKDIVCGKNHVLILSTAGDVISWGSNEYGQLARLRTPSHSPLLAGDAAYDLSPHFVENLPANILGIGASKTGSFAWDEDHLYAWGDNTYGQLGYEFASSPVSRWKRSASTSTVNRDGKDIVVVPRAVTLHWKGKSIKQVLGGLRHTVILANSGLIITMGDDEFGQLGATAQLTTAMGSSSNLASRSASPLQSSQSRMGQSPLSSLGGSSWTNLESHLSSSSILPDASGDGPSPLGSPRLRGRRLNPTLVRVGPRVKEISCGDFHTVTCCENGQMYAWGQDYDGILAIHNAYTQQYLQQQRGVGIDGRMSLKSVNTDFSLQRDKARKVVSVSTMQHGASVALVSSA